MLRLMSEVCWDSEAEPLGCQCFVNVTGNDWKSCNDN